MIAAAAEVEHQVGELAPVLAAMAEVEHQVGELAPVIRRCGEVAAAEVAAAEVGELALMVRCARLCARCQVARSVTSPSR